MTATQTTVDISTTDVYSGVMDAGAVQCARDLLAGYSGGYFFYQSAADKYVLILSDDYSIASGLGGYSVAFPACDWYEIEVTYSSHSVAVQESGSASGSASGGYAGYPSAGQYSGNYSGNYSGSFSLQAADPPVYQLRYYHDDDGVSFLNRDNYLVYGSFDGLPHLIEGGTYYAFAQTAILVVMCLFVLVSRIFKHVS